MKDWAHQLVVLEHPGWMTFKGKTRIRCICGCINIYGYDVSSSSKTYDVYSTDSHSFVMLKTTEGCHGDVLGSSDFSVFVEGDQRLSLEDRKIISSYHRPVVIVFEKLTNPALDYVDTLKPFHTLFRGDGKLRGRDDVHDMVKVGIQLHGQHSPISPLLSVKHYTAINEWIDIRVSEGKF